MNKSMSWQSKLAPLAVIFLAGLIAVAIVQSKKPAQKKTVEKQLQKVSVQVAQKQQLAMPIFSQGVVEPRTKIRLLPEVAGKIINVSPNWENGGFFRKGEVFLEIEDHNYQNQLAKAQASLARAKSSLTQEQGLAFVARQDWEKRKKKTDNEAARSLALREPQLASAEAQVHAAEADVISARKNLENTKIRAPFDGIVLKKAADIGQNISAGQMLAEYYAIDIAEVRVPLTEAQLIFLDLSKVGERMDVPAEIRYTVEDKVIELQGTLVRTEGLLDSLTKVLYAVIEVQDPYGLQNDQFEPLRLGSFVEVSMLGKKLDNIFILPRRALRAGNKLWIVDENNILVSKDVKLLPLREENIFISEGLSDGDKVVVGGMIDPIEGIEVIPVVKEAEARESL